MPAVPAVPPAWQERRYKGGAEALARYQAKRRAEQIEQREVRQKVVDVSPEVAASDQASEEMNEESGVPVDADNPPKSPSRHEAFMSNFWSDEGACSKTSVLDCLSGASERNEDFLICSFELSEADKERMLQSPELFLVKKMRASEVNISKLSDMDRELFDEAKAREV